MTDEIKLRRDLDKAARAESLLRNELLTEAYDRIEADLIKAWIASEPRDVDGRERCFLAVHANRKHKDYLKSVINDGKLAQAELKQLVEGPKKVWLR